MIVVFDDVTPPQYLESGEKTSASPSDSEQRIIELEQELAYTKENLLSAIEELETANEQFQLTNEELQSTNEELQSTNLELELSKEQLQSLNEELKSINKELQGKVFELSDINNDMKNLLDSTHIATIFVDKNLCIKRFTPEATKIINLIKTDLGRPLNHLVSNLIYKNLIEDVKNVLNTLINHEAEVQTKGGR